MPVITVLHVPGCAGGQAALAIADKLATARADITVTDVVVTPSVDAVAAGFRGSPTVLIDGRDVEPDPPAPLGSLG